MIGNHQRDDLKPQKEEDPRYEIDFELLIEAVLREMFQLLLVFFYPKMSHNNSFTQPLIVLPPIFNSQFSIRRGRGACGGQ